VPKLSHNKKRNVGLVYELLAREVAKAALDRSGTAALRAAEALEIITRHLGPKSVLSEELSIHRSVMEAKGSTGALARRIVDELRAAGIRLSGTSVQRESAKTTLIHEINRRLGQETFDNRVADYTAHASVGIILGRGLGRLDEGVEMARVEEHLVSFLGDKVGHGRALDPDASLHTYQTALRIFEEDYGATLSKDQADLLKEHVRVALGGPHEPLERMVQKQKKSLRSKLSMNLLDEAFKSDEKMTASLKEAIQKIDSVPSTEDGVEQLMLYHNLVREIESK
jgi:hypothetical protein